MNSVLFDQLFASCWVGGKLDCPNEQGLIKALRELLGIALNYNFVLVGCAVCFAFRPRNFSGIYSFLLPLLLVSVFVSVCVCMCFHTFLCVCVCDFVLVGSH